MAFTLDDTAFANQMHDSDVPNISDVRNILFESVDMPTFVRNETTFNVSEASPNRVRVKSSNPPMLDDLIEDEESEQEDDNDFISEESDTDEEALDEPTDHPLNETSQERIKVFLRVRPEEMALNYEMDDKEKILWVKTMSKTTTGSKESNLLYFKFDLIFRDSIEQWPVVQSCALPLVKDFILGENSLLFTYGITSSGKSYTMRGDRTNPGIIPSSLNILFEVLSDYLSDGVPELKPTDFCNIKQLKTKGEKLLERRTREPIIDNSNVSPAEIRAFTQYSADLINSCRDSIIRPFAAAFKRDLEDNSSDGTQVQVGIWVSYYEIYNNKVFDLLNPGKHNRRESTVTIKKNDKQQTFLDGLKVVYVNSPLEAFKVFLFGQEVLKKHISSTALNANSSRSHSSFNMTLVRFDGSTEMATISNISFVDLAGRERCKKSKVTEVQKKETIEINKSLFHLGHCISNLRSQKNSSGFVNYRDSKLTQIFQPYLSGSGGRTYIIYNLNPKQELFDDSYYSLDFCNAVKKVKQNPAPSKVLIKINLSRLSLKADLEQSFAEVEEEDEELMQSLRQGVNDLTTIVTNAADPNEELLEQIQLLREKVAAVEQAKRDQEMSLRTKMFNELERQAKEYEAIIDQNDITRAEQREIFEERLKFTAEQSKKDYEKVRALHDKTNLELFEAMETIETLKQTNEKMSVEVEGHDITINVMQSTIEALRHSNEKMSVEIEERDISLKKMQSTIETNEVTIRELNLEHSKMQSKKDETIRSLHDMSQLNAEVDEKRRQLEKQLAEKEKFIEDLQDKWKMTRLAQEQAKLNEQRFEAENETLRTKLLAAIEKQVITEEKLSTTEDQLMAMEDDLQSEKSNLKESQTKIEKMQTIIKTKDIQLAERAKDANTANIKYSKRIVELEQLNNVLSKQLAQQSAAMAAAATTSSQASANDSIITVNTMSDISSLAPSQFSFDNQENTNPKPKATRSRKPRVVKPKISEEDRELIASVSKRNKHIDMHAHDDMTLLFSAQKERLQFSIKKKLHESTSKRVDTSPILSPRDAQANIDASNSSRPYNTRKHTTRRRGNLFN